MIYRFLHLLYVTLFGGPATETNQAYTQDPPATASFSPPGLGFFSQYKILIIGMMFFLLLLTNWLVKNEERKSKEKENPLEQQIALQRKQDSYNSLLSPEDIKRLLGYLAVQDKLFKKILFHDLKLKTLEKHMYNTSRRGKPQKRPGKAKPFALNNLKNNSDCSTNSAKSSCSQH
ncbi:testis-expressed protein 46 [Ambystoma mexicanum]|uniref:testis-expressed protein 46 n=1 Tax=Ambystoma mexicanum TaxID=8296 RepID=UPI0037E72F3A